MEIFSALLAFCEENPSITGGFPSQRPMTRSFDVFADRRLNKRANNRDDGNLRHHRADYDVTLMIYPHRPRADHQAFSISLWMNPSAWTIVSWYPNIHVHRKRASYHVIIWVDDSLEWLLSAFSPCEESKGSLRSKLAWILVLGAFDWDANWGIVFRYWINFILKLYAIWQACTD